MATIRQTTITLGGKPVQLTQLPVRSGRPVLVRLTSRLPVKVPSVVGNLAGASGGSEGGEEVAAIEWCLELFRNAMLDLDYFCEVFGNASMIGGKTLLDADQQDILFADSYDDLFRWVYESLVLNFGSLGRLLPQGGKEVLSVALQAAVEKMGASPAGN